MHGRPGAHLDRRARAHLKSIVIGCACVIGSSWALMLVPPGLWWYIGLTLFVLVAAPIWLLRATLAARSTRGAAIFAIVVCVCFATPVRLAAGSTPSCTRVVHRIDGAGLLVLLADGWLPVLI